ncbi:hypothetical protein JA1_000199 [Spathaspora sp. JA1]|nr:hypothetical protein JA1_000199 [Spathaspora sp. JA1]
MSDISEDFDIDSLNSENMWYKRQLAKINLVDKYTNNFEQTLEQLYNKLYNAKERKSINTIAFWNDFITVVESIYPNIRTYFENPQDFEITKDCVGNLEYKEGGYMVENIGIQLELLDKFVVDFIKSKCNLIDDICIKQATMKEVYQFFKSGNIPSSAGTLYESDELIMKDTLQSIFSRAMSLRQQTLLWMLALSDQIKKDQSECYQFLNSIPFEFILAYITMRQDNDASGGILRGYIPFSYFLANEFILYKEDKESYRMKPISTVLYLLRTDPEVDSEHFTNLSNAYSGSRGTINRTLKSQKRKVDTPKRVHWEQPSEAFHTSSGGRKSPVRRLDKSWRIEKPKHTENKEQISNTQTPGVNVRELIDNEFKRKAAESVSSTQVETPNSFSISPVNLKRKTSSLVKPLSPKPMNSIINLDNRSEPDQESASSCTTDHPTNAITSNSNDENKVPDPPKEQIKPSPLKVSKSMEKVKPLSYKDIILKYARPSDIISVTNNSQIKPGDPPSPNTDGSKQVKGRSVYDTWEPEKDAQKPRDNWVEIRDIAPTSCESRIRETKSNEKSSKTGISSRTEIRAGRKCSVNSALRKSLNEENGRLSQKKLVRFHKKITIPY